MNYYTEKHNALLRRQLSIPKIEQCETCEGTGEITIPHYHSLDGYTETTRRCDECNGTGRADDKTVAARRQALYDAADWRCEECRACGDGEWPDECPECGKDMTCAE
jgi:RecJ-like exonuclease